MWEREGDWRDWRRMDWGNDWQWQRWWQRLAEARAMAGADVRRDGRLPKRMDGKATLAVD